MSEKKLCPLCNRRPPRRSCPALEKDICAVCCGTEREQSIGCPLDCTHLREAREHEKSPEFDPATLPNADFDLTERFMDDHQDLAVIAGSLLLVAAMSSHGAVDSDVREALAALVTSFKSAQSGVIYEPRPGNAVAAAVVERFREELEKFRASVLERTPGHPVLDKDLLGVLVFWQRTEYHRSNGRRKGRAFLESLYSILPPPPEQKEDPASGIIAG